MIRRTVKIQLAIFLVISLLGIFYVGINYVGFHVLRPGPYPVTLMLSDAGGIFPNAEVTERGVSVGRVSSMRVHGRGVAVKLLIEHGKRIPADLHATVANLSAVGEQYVDLAPQTDTGPYLHAGSVIPASRATVPIDDATLLLDLDRLVNSVNRSHLATVINELGKGFNDLGPALQSLIDNGNSLTQAAIDSLPAQLKLINDGVKVLDTQNAVASQLKSWASTFASFTDQLRVSDQSIRGVLTNGIPAARAVQGLLKDNEGVLPTLLGNLITVNQIQAVRLPYVRGLLELYPSETAGGFYVTPGDGTAHFGMVSQNNPLDQPQSPCVDGYQSTRIRGNNDNGTTPSDWGGPANLDAWCKAPPSQNVDNRGARFAPRPDNAEVTNSDPYPGPVYGKSNQPTVAQQRGGSTSALATPAAGGATATAGPGGDTIIPLPYDPATGLLTGLDGKTYQLGYTGPLAPIFGSSSWDWLLLAPTMR